MPAIKPYPMQMVRVRSSKTIAPPMAAHSPATSYDRSRMLQQPLCRIAGEVVLSHQFLVDKLSATETWTKSRAGKQAEAGGGTQRVRCTPSYAP